MNLVLSIFPIALLIWLMVKKNSVPSSTALPLIALLLYFLKLVFFQSNPNDVHANVVAGLLTAWTPILIVAGAIFLFRTMEHSGAMDIVRRWLNSVTDNKIAQLMIVGWAFAYLIEGASGFGTPAALAAPILVGLGFEVVPVAILCLVMNSVPVSFGAVGTPTWFGFKEIALSESEVLSVGYKTALVHGTAALIIPIIALLFIVKWEEIRRNIVFIYLSILSCVVPMILLATFNYEFPSIIGGGIGLVISVMLAHWNIGLKTSKIDINVESHDHHNIFEDEDIPRELEEKGHLDTKPSTGELIKASFPLWGTVLILIITRIQQLGIKDLLIYSEPFINIKLGTFGSFGLSPALSVSLTNIFETNYSWSHKLLYVPSFIPFLLISVITFAVFHMKSEEQWKVCKETIHQLYHPILALLGALVMVKLLMMDGANANTRIIGNALAETVGEYWQYGAALLGALGSFFSGSATISNLTFGAIQDAIALELNLDRTTILALQSVGGAMGNMVCINNIVAVCSVLALENKEGVILKRTVIPLMFYALIAAFVATIL